MPSDAPGKAEVMQWLMFQMSGFGVAFSQLNYFLRVAPQRVPAAIERFHNESVRVMGVLDRHLSSHDFVARQYSIADIALYPWAVTARQLAPELFSASSGILQWMQRVGERPAVEKGMKVPDLQR